MRSAGRLKSGNGSLLAIPAFVVLYGGVAAAWGVPSVFLILYVVASIVCFAAYAVDKAAAQRDGWRVSEKSLLWIGLAGGWPGAIVAQVVLRHKSIKPDFRLKFWLTVLLNVAAFVLLCSPYCPPAVREGLQAISPAIGGSESI